MKQHFLLLALIIFSPPFGFFLNSANIIKSISSLLKSTVGGIKFARDFVEYKKQELRDTTPSDRIEYDYIVVGAGSAGATLAARLSEVKNATVLLIESGNNENLIHDIPLLALHLQLDKNINWDYHIEPSDKYCLAMENHRCKIPKGKVMGGSSTINFMLAVRGTKNDYDEWARLTDDPIWSYEEVLKYFKKLENHNVTLVDVDPRYHGTNGPINIVDPPYVSHLGKAFVEAGREMGLPPVDYNGQKLTGFNYVQTNQINGERLSANRAYLHPARNRKNLFVSLSSHVNKVLIDPATKTAHGVEFTKGLRKIKVTARKEVILSAGAIASPQILMLSGVGPTAHLRDLGIDVNADLPVGENLLDHVSYPALLFFVNQSDGIFTERSFDSTNSMIANYLSNRKGYFATAGGVEGIGYINVDDSITNNSDPNVEFVFTSVSLLSDYSIYRVFGIQSSYYNRYLADQLHRTAWSIWPILLKPRSRGRILLRSSNPKVHPKIIANHFSDPDDIRVMIKAIRMAIKVSKTKAMQLYGSKLYARPIPGCERYQQDSDGYWECAIRTFAFGFWHEAGTCKMGREDDPTAVVNSKLQVKGINRLRVVDASIMPTIPAAHHNIPTIAIAEILADIIKSSDGYT